AAVVLQAATDDHAGARRVVRGSRADVADADCVVLERIDGAVVQALPVGGVAVRVDGAIEGTSVDAAVVADVDVLDAEVGADRSGMLVGVRGLWAAVRRAVGRVHRVGGPAAEVEVPVRPDGGPGGPAVLRLVDLLEAGVDVVDVRRIDDEELVVPAL